MNKYKSLNDASKHLDTLSKGSTKIWYMKPEHFRSGICGEKPGGDIEKTHILLGEIKETDPEQVFVLLQGDNWSPNGEACDLIKSLGLKHTSISVGDVVEIDGTRHLVAFFGFTKLSGQMTTTIKRIGKPGKKKVAKKTKKRRANA